MCGSKNSIQHRGTVVDLPALRIYPLAQFDAPNLKLRVHVLAGSDSLRTVEKTVAERVENLKPFPKGVSGNPGGRPKTKPVTEELERLLQQEAPEKKGQTWAAAIAEALVSGINHLAVGT